MLMETSRILGGVGALLMFIGIIPFISFYGIVELIGLVLVLIALYDLGSHYAEGGIFNNALYGLIIGIVGVVIAVAVIILAFLSSLTDFLYTIFPSWNGDWIALSNLTPDLSKISLDTVMPVITGISVGLIIFWVSCIIAAYFVRRSLGTLSTKSGVGLFSTTGLLILIGAVLIILIGFGLILIWISALVLAIAFFRIRPRQTQPTTSAPT